MPTGITRDEQIRRAAEMRASTVAWLNNQTEPKSISDIAEGISDKMAELDYKNDDLANVMSRLRDHGMVSSKMVEEGKFRKNLYATKPELLAGIEEYQPPEKYRKKGSEKLIPPAKAARIVPIEEDRPVASPVQTSSGTPALTVDIVKSTGRVRLTLQGFVMEIGVVER